MNIRKEPHGLYMSADTNEQKEIAQIIEFARNGLVAEEAFISDYLHDFEQVRPEEVGALTGAPLISDGENIYGFMSYQTDCFLEMLANGKEVFWKKG